jgi:hypothetical protein
VSEEHKDAATSKGHQGRSHKGHHIVFMKREGHGQADGHEERLDEEQ